MIWSSSFFSSPRLLFSCGRWHINLLNEALDLILDRLKPVLGGGWLGGVHLVDGHNKLLDKQVPRKELDRELLVLHIVGVQVLARSAHGTLVWDRDVTEQVSSL